jgi:hypothetical protein
MLKHIYKAIILIFVFGVSVYYFSKDMKEQVFKAAQTIEMSEASFPIITLRLDKEEVNQLHGYSNNLTPNLVRESITPLDSEQSFIVVIDEKENEVKRVIYELRSITDNKLLETDTINALEKEDEYKTAKIKLKTELNQTQEYAVKITLVTNKSRKINYYTRVKLEPNSYHEEQIAFAINFHNTILDKNRAEEMIIYMEPEAGSDNTSLAYVDIHSSFELVSWGNLTPTVVGEIIPTITDLTSDIGSIVFHYTVSSQTASGQEYYDVKEFFRVRYTSSRMYLLNYERTMESIFDLELTSLNKSEFKIGITNNPEIELVTSADNNKISFVRQRELWYYNRPENAAVRVFSFRQEETDYIRDNYNQHDVRILNMDEDGNINFLVFGYMNRGVYEGRVGIALYRFYSGENRIEELVYIPMNVTYQILKEQLDEFSYVSQIGTFYFTIHNKIYSYNLTTKRMATIASDINENNFIVSKEKHYIAWQNSSQPEEATQITILDLESGQKKIIEASANNNIRLLGKIDNNIVYGFAETKDITTTVDGNPLVPMYKIEIADFELNVLKEYSKDGYYITDTVIDNNVITLNRVRVSLVNGKVQYETARPDNILNKVEEKNTEVEVSKRVTEQTLTEYYISLPAGFIMEEQPRYSETSNTVITEDTTLRLDNSEELPGQYVVYATGEIKGFYDEPSEAILKADSFAGVVLNKEQQVIWERGAKSSTSSITGITPDYEVNDSVIAGSRTLIKYRNGSMYSVNGSHDSAYELLTQNIGDDLLNLTDCTLDEVLYYVSKKRPVLAMKDNNNAVLIVGYDLYNITIIDLEFKRTMKIGMNDSMEMFQNAGNIFISYTE